MYDYKVPSMDGLRHGGKLRAIKESRFCIENDFHIAIVLAESPKEFSSKNLLPIQFCSVIEERKCNKGLGTRLEISFNHSLETIINGP